MPSGDIAPAKRGFSIAESELGISANVDDKFSGNLIFSLAPDDSVEVEEAYGVLTALPDGFTPKFGRFFSGIGYLNDQHQHVWDFYDAPLPYQAFLGGQFKSDGLQLKWVAPTETFLEFGAEIGDGANFPGGERNSNGIGAWAALRARRAATSARATAGARAVLSAACGRSDRSTSQADTRRQRRRSSRFHGKSQLAIADFVWKYAPNGNARDTNFKLQGEYFWRARDRRSHLRQRRRARPHQHVELLVAAERLVHRGRLPVHAGVARRRALRPARSRQRRTTAPTAPTSRTTSFNPQRYSLMLDYTPSEFSRFRVQWQQSKMRPELTDNQLFVQYILTLGAHGAHKF